MDYTNNTNDCQYTSLRITKELHKALRKAAKKNKTIFYHFTEDLIKKALKENDRD